MRFSRTLLILFFFLLCPGLLLARNPLGDRYLSVVTVITKQVRMNYLYQGEVPSGVGTGVLVDKEGHVLVPAPLVSRAGWIDVCLPNGRHVGGTLVGIDYLTETALLRLKDTAGLKPAPLASSTPATGSSIHFIGRPRQKVVHRAANIIEKHRLVVHRGVALSGFLVTDLKLEGLGAGPVFDSRGNLLGLAINLPDFQTPQGVMLVPPYLFRLAYSKLKEKGRAEWPWLGVKLLPLSPSLAKILKIPVSQGALIEKVYPGSPARIVGLRGANKEVSVGNVIYPLGGDVIVSIDRKRVSSPEKVDALIYQHGPGEIIEIGFYRQKKLRRVKLRLGRRSFVQP
ncbi:MAG: PDZ domain-containing protein [Thermodesulfobacteria bacterium]|nr:PDZ domain-containing protein [Thermodesulfobacteriota bacterium]